MVTINDFLVYPRVQSWILEVALLPSVLKLLFKHHYLINDAAKENQFCQITQSGAYYVLMLVTIVGQNINMQCPKRRVAVCTCVNKTWTQYHQAK